MAPARETYERINQIHQIIGTHLTRFTTAYIPSPECLKAIISYKSQLQTEHKLANAIYERYTEPFNKENQIEQARLQQEKQQQLQQIQREYQNKAGGSSVPPQFAAEHQQKNQEAERAFRGKIEELQQSLQKKHLDTDSKELEEIEQRLNKLVDQVLELERALKGQELLQRTQQGLANHKQLFEAACAAHRRIAWFIACALLLILLGGFFALYKYFINNKIEFPLGANLKDVHLSISLLILASGLTAKLAFLIAWGAALKYLADLYKRNSMQSVLYKDRSMALDIVESLLAITPQLEQKKELLNTLSAGYLDFEKNAFHHKFDEAGKDGETPIKHLKETIDTIKPLFESLKGVFEKEKAK